MSPLPPPLALMTEASRTQLVLAIFFPLISTLSLIARLAARRIKCMSLGPDDYVIMPAVLFVYGQCIIVIFSAVYGGIGLNVTSVGPENLIVLFKLLIAAQFTFSTSLGLAKISLCLLQIRIFPSQRFQIAAHIALAYCVCWILMAYFIAAAICQPFAYNWDKTIPNGHCGNLDAAYVAIAAFDILGDLAIIALPMRQVWRLHVRKTTKVGLTILFALGILNVIVAIIRIVYLLKISFAPGGNFTSQAAQGYAWSVIEPNLGFTVANAAVISPAVERGVNYMVKSLTKLNTRSIFGRIWSSYSLKSSAARSVSIPMDVGNETDISPHRVRQTIAIDVTSISKPIV